LKSGIVASGVVSTVVGVVILLLSIMTVPYTTSRLEEVPYSTVWINESFVVPEYHFYYYYNLVNFSSEDTLHINFNVTEGGSVDFWVMNETNFAKFNLSQSFYYYVVPSRSSISKLDVLWFPPSNQ